MLSSALKKKQETVDVPIDRGLFEALEAIGGMRDIHPHTIIAIQMTAYVRAFERSQVLMLRDIMPYGQYKGELVEDVIKVNPRYIQYLVANSNNFRLDTDAIELLESLDIVPYTKVGCDEQ